MRAPPGVNGIVTEVELPLAPAYEWLDTVVLFDEFVGRAAEFGMALATHGGILKQLASVRASPIPSFFNPLRIPEAKAAALLMIGAETREAFEALVKGFGGTLTHCVPEAGICEYALGAIRGVALQRLPDRRGRAALPGPGLRADGAPLPGAGGRGRAAQVAFRRSTDPHLLMNPGKVAGLDDLPGGLSGAALEAAQLPASGWAH